jgi:hypothetical protein
MKLMRQFRMGRIGARATVPDRLIHLYVGVGRVSMTLAAVFAAAAVPAADCARWGTCVWFRLPGPV